MGGVYRHDNTHVYGIGYLFSKIVQFEESGTTFHLGLYHGGRSYLKHKHITSFLRNIQISPDNYTTQHYLNISPTEKVFPETLSHHRTKLEDLRKLYM